MKTIASFTVNHNILEKGVYLSRVDGDVRTFDVRMKKPNGGDYIPTPAAHTIEHLFATFARNSAFGDAVIYVGPMGCRTGFYLLLRDSVADADVITLLQETFAFIRDFEGEIPGNTAIECGNYREHDLDGARAIARDMADVLAHWTPRDMQYKEV